MPGRVRAGQLILDSAFALHGDMHARLARPPFLARTIAARSRGWRGGIGLRFGIRRRPSRARESEGSIRTRSDRASISSGLRRIASRHAAMAPGKSPACAQTWANAR